MKAWLYACLLMGLAVGSASTLSCQPESEQGCDAGSQGCECSSGQCFAGLTCVFGVCQPSSNPATTGETSDETDAPATTNDADSSDGGSGSGSADTTEGGGACQGTDGTVGCPCLAGNQCLGDLECDSNQTCICLSGTPCGDSDCVQDFETDNRHCGTCGNECSVFGQTFGVCTAGECPPTLSDCVVTSEVTTCEAVCLAQGRSCVAQGCGSDGITWIQFGNTIACEDFSHAGDGMTACNQDLAAVVVQDSLRCCCTPP